jgi:protein TonB
MNQAAGAEVDALTELEPTAAAVEAPAAPEPEPQEPLTGWASLQARLTRTAPQPAAEAPAKSELLSYGETPSHGSAPAEPSAEERKDVAQSESQPESGSEAALFAYISGEAKEPEQPAPETRSKLLKVLLMGALAAACVILVAVPQARQRLQGFYRNSVRAGGGLLNPAPAPVPQAAAQHDSFGQSGDEYKLPVAGNIPDATTDPSQIRVVPVVDPTGKPEKNAEANGGQAQATAGANNVTDSNQPGASQPGSSQAGQAQAGDGQVKDPALTSVGEVPGSTAGVVPSPVASPAPPALQVQQNPAVPQASAPQLLPVARPVQNSAPRPAPSPAGSSSIPSSLKSQIASMTPDSSGAKPVEAAMSSIEPVNLPESAAWELLAQPVDPVYPAAAKASGQRGSVVLQVLIGRDGAVQDAKFLQGSLVFAWAAIDAVKQWRFKPYTLNGRAVSVQSVITLNFKPPA